jgi:hypothetical protein
MMKQIGHKSVVHLTSWDACSKWVAPLPGFFGIGQQKWATLLALISVKKERLGGFEPWSAQWEGRELPLSYNMISVPLVYVIHLINILMVHHPHLNLQNKKRCTHGI